MCYWECVGGSPLLTFYQSSVFVEGNMMDLVNFCHSNHLYSVAFSRYSIDTYKIHKKSCAIKSKSWMHPCQYPYNTTPSAVHVKSNLYNTFHCPCQCLTTSSNRPAQGCVLNPTLGTHRLACRPLFSYFLAKKCEVLNASFSVRPSNTLKVPHDRLLLEPHPLQC